MDLTLRASYWDDSKARGAFKMFIREIHNVDFSEWESRGYWDEAYTPFSFFHGEEIVASVCVYLLDAVVNGEATHLVQISGVGTLPGWRRRGLNRRLTETGLAWSRGRHDGVFLFADEEAIPFYERCGFRPVVDYVERIEAAPVQRRGPSVRLDCGEQRSLDRIYELAKRRAPVSNRLSVMNAKLFMFHVLNGLKERAFEIPALDCIVFLDRTEGLLTIFDILGEEIPRFEDLYPFIADDGDRVMEFRFSTDRLGLNGTSLVPISGGNCFVKGVFPVERPVFPFTSRA